MQTETPDLLDLAQKYKGGYGQNAGNSLLELGNEALKEGKPIEAAEIFLQGYRASMGYRQNPSAGDWYRAGVDLIEPLTKLGETRLAWQLLEIARDWTEGDPVRRPQIIEQSFQLIDPLIQARKFLEAQIEISFGYNETQNPERRKELRAKQFDLYRNYLKLGVFCHYETGDMSAWFMSRRYRPHSPGEEAQKEKAQILDEVMAFGEELAQNWGGELGESWVRSAQEYDYNTDNSLEGIAAAEALGKIAKNNIPLKTCQNVDTRDARGWPIWIIPNPIDIS